MMNFLQRGLVSGEVITLPIMTTLITSQPWLGLLTKLLRPDQCSTSESVLNQHAKGESFDKAVSPDVVVFPEATQDVQRVIRFAYEHGIPVTPVAVNSSLEGHTVPVRGGISLDMTRMNKILEFRAEDLLIVVQPAVTYPQINEHTKRNGLFFPIDPGAHASLGGMISTNASGTAAVRYGVTGDYVLALEVVTPTGEIIRTGSRARKSSSGYSLTRLFCGAEGTLGVITEVTLKLVGLPEAASAARVPFKDAESATSFVTSIIQAGVPVARCEIVDPQTIHAVNNYKQTSYPEEMTVFLEFHGNREGVKADAVLAQELAEHHGALTFEASSDAEERAKLWEARHSVFYAQLAENKGRRNIVTDVAVPISKLPEVVTASLQRFREAGLNTYLVGHVGDGNFHLAVFFDDKLGELERVEAVSEVMVNHALQVDGTSTGEHGVGLRKLKYMEREHGNSLELMRTIKQTLDPKGIMNPGKKVVSRQ
jgi:D-lactate dehydrogenase (cytochrome)